MSCWTGSKMDVHNAFQSWSLSSQDYVSLMIPGPGGKDRPRHDLLACCQYRYGKCLHSRRQLCTSKLRRSSYLIQMRTTSADLEDFIIRKITCLCSYCFSGKVGISASNPTCLPSSVCPTKLDMLAMACGRWGPHQERLKKVRIDSHKILRNGMWQDFK